MSDNLNGRRPSTVRDVKVAVIGAGLMGHSIAGVFAAAGATVSLYDPFPGALDAAPARIRLQLDALGKDPEIVDGINLSSELETAVAGADFVVEAVPEN